MKQPGYLPHFLADGASLWFLCCFGKEGMMIVLVVVGVGWLRSLMVVGWIDAKVAFLKVLIFTFYVQILGNTCIQIENICTFTYRRS
jgi:hypothetical protein